MKYHILIDNIVVAKVASFDDALLFLADALYRGNECVIDLIDTEVGLPFDRAALLRAVRERGAEK